MSTDQLVDAIGKQTSRRKFLRRVGVSAMAVSAAVLGLPAEAEATIRYKCCNLCKSPSSSCGSCACVWCWTCCNSLSNFLKYRCCECHSNTSACGAACASNVRCSTGTRISGGC